MARMPFDGCAAAWYFARTQEKVDILDEAIP